MDPAGEGRKRRRVVLLGDGLWAAEALRFLVPRHDVPAVVLRREATDGSLEAVALELGISCHVLEDVNAPSSVAWLGALSPDLLLSVSYDQIFRRPLVDASSPPILNLHAGDPAHHRGRAILCWQMLEGAREIPLSVMRVTPGIDDGPLLALHTIPLEDECDYSHALVRLALHVPHLLEHALVALDEGHVLELDPGARPRYYPRRRAGDEWIDWERPAAEILRLIRALAPPNCQARTRLGEMELLVGGAGPWEAACGSAGAPGAVVGKDVQRGLLVRCQDGALWIRALQRMDGSPVDLGRIHLSRRFAESAMAERQELRRRVVELESRLARLEARVLIPAPDASHGV